jgi:hypothetical protein
VGTGLFPDVLYSDAAGPDGSSLLLSLKLAIDVLVSCKRIKVSLQGGSFLPAGAVQVVPSRSMSTCGLYLLQSVTWTPFSHVDLAS